MISTLAKAKLGKSTIVLPPGIGELVVPEVELPTEKQFIVVRHPTNYLASLYFIAESLLTFKEWFKANPPPTQVSYCPDYDVALRANFFYKDFKEATGLDGTLMRTVIPPVHVCMATRANIRRIYKCDYEAGDFD